MSGIEFASMIEIKAVMHEEDHINHILTQLFWIKNLIHFLGAGFMSIRRVGFLKNEIVFNLLDKILSLSVTKVFNNSCNFFFIVILNLILSKSYDISIDL